MKIIHVIGLCLLTLLIFSCHRADRYTLSKIDKQNILIVIDPGHGGKDPGARAQKKYNEKHFCLATAKLLQQHLKKMGYNTLMTRTKDSYIPLSKRANLANKEQATIFVSVHYNSSHNPKARGLEVFFNESLSKQWRSSQSKRLAKNILSHMTLLTKEPSRGVKQANFTVLINTWMPAVLVEGGFMSNTEDMELIQKSSYWNKIALGIARGIDDYFNFRQQNLLSESLL